MQAVILDFKTEKDAQSQGFIMYDVLVKLENGQTWEIKKRYNDFNKLHVTLNKLFSSQLPKFPPKMLFNMIPSKIKKRKIELQTWLDGVLKSREMACSNPVLEFFEVNLRSTTYSLPPQQQQQSGPSLSLNLGPLSVSLNTPPTPQQQQVYIQPSTVTMHTPVVEANFGPNASISMNMGTTTTSPDYHMSQQMTNGAFGMNTQINNQIRQDVGNDPLANGILNMQQGMSNMIQVGMQQGMAQEYQNQQQYGYTQPPQANFQFSTSSTSSSTSTHSGPNMGFSVNMNMTGAEPAVSMQQAWTQSPPPSVQTQPQYYSSNSQAMDPSSFATFLDSFKNQNFSSEKVDFIKMNFKNHYFTSDQAVQLMDVCSFSDENIAAAVELYPRLVDQQNFFKVMDKVSFHSDKEKIKETLNL
jgi:hypothetical protein